MKFSQRIGKRPIKTILQVESIDTDLRNRLWNIILEKFFDQLEDYTSDSETQKGKVCKFIWKEFYGQPIDTIPSYHNSNIVVTAGCVDYIRKWFYEGEWYDVYDLLEFVTAIAENTLRNNFTDSCNNALEREVAGYRIVNHKIVQITSDNEVKEIQEAIDETDKWKSVNTHLLTALDLLADRKNPDFRNSIKESISAVESLCKIITNDKNATLGKALSEIEKKKSLHGALKTAFSALYGYASDAGGIRHALLEGDKKVGFEDAKFILVSCSAFTAYLKVKIEL
jgi:hypothetical protein